jgi:hypothetical protein
LWGFQSSRGSGSRYYQLRTDFGGDDRRRSPGDGFRCRAGVVGAAGGHGRHSGAYTVGMGLYLDRSVIAGARILRIHYESAGVKASYRDMNFIVINIYSRFHQDHRMISRLVVHDGSIQRYI